MLVKYMAILLALSVVVLAGKKDEYQRGGGCPCADFKSYEARDDESYSRGKSAPTGDDFSSRMRERKAFLKRQEKLRPRFPEGVDDVDEEMYTGYNFYEGSDGFLSRRDGETRKQMKDKKYRRDDYDADDDLDVSPQCQRYMNDVNRLVKCELKMSRMAPESSSRRSFVSEFPDVPAVCQKYVSAEDPSKLARCVRKSAVDVEPQAVYPECVDFANDPYKLQKCERKARKYAGASMGKMLF